MEEEQYASRRSYVEPGTGAVLPPPVTGLKLTRGRATSTVARYLHSASTNTGHYHHHHHGLHGQYPPGSTGRPTGRHHQHHHPSRGSFSNETQEEVQEDDEATLRELLVRYVSPDVPHDNILNLPPLSRHPNLRPNHPLILIYLNVFCETPPRVFSIFFFHRSVNTQRNDN